MSKDKNEIMQNKSNLKESQYKFFPSPQKATQSAFAIIDMQPRFIASKKAALISALENAINKAMKDGDYILIVNYDTEVMEYVNGKMIPVPIEQRETKNHLQPTLSLL